MDSRAAELIDLLQLDPHPEGGYYREVYRSVERVQLSDGREERQALTTIYFLLTQGDYSCWHRVISDEVWHFYEGEGLELFCLKPGATEYDRFLVGAVDRVHKPTAIIPAGCWQAARPIGAYVLVGCTVGPGFEFADFQMLRDIPEVEHKMRLQFPELAIYIS